MTRLQKKESIFKRALLLLLIIVFLPPLIIFLVVFFIYHYLKGILLGYRVKSNWLPKGKNILFVTSNSPVWNEYVAAKILPKITKEAITINWSERSHWEQENTLESKVFFHFAGVGPYKLYKNSKTEWWGSEFCPVAVVFKPWWRPKVIRFWQAFKDFKHGNDKKLMDCEKELFRLVEEK